MDLYLTIRQLSAYSTLSVSFIEKNLHRIPHYRIGKRILIKKSEFDQWLQQYKVWLQKEPPIEEIVAEILGQDSKDWINEEEK